MKQLIALCLCLFLGFAPAAWGQEKEQTSPQAEVTQTKKKSSKKGFQNFRGEKSIQLLLHGGGGDQGGPELSNAMAGGQIGVQFNQSWYLGVAFSQPVRADHCEGEGGWNGRDYDEKVYGQDRGKVSQAEGGEQSLLEARWSPWAFGLYFSAGVMQAKAQSFEVEHKKRSRVLGENEYNTGMKTSIQYETWTGGSLGAGFTHVFKNGFTLGSGFALGLTAGQSPQVTVEAVDSSSSVSQSDLDDWQSQIEEHESRHPSFAYVGIGYSF